MTPFSWFCLSLRIMGAWILVQSIQYFVAAFDVTHGFDVNTQYKVEVYLNQGVTHIAIGLVLIVLAPALAALVYRQKAAAHEQATEESA